MAKARLTPEVLRAMIPDPIPLPEQEYRFHPERAWRFDFAWPKEKVAIEIDGGIFKGGKCHVCGGWRGGRHNRPAGMIRDMEKRNHAASRNWLVFSFLPGPKGWILGKVDWELVSQGLAAPTLWGVKP